MLNLDRKIKTKDDTKLIANRIKQAMGKNYDMKSLAEHTGASYSNIREILDARVTPKVTTIIAISRVLDVSMDWLCGLRED